MQVRPLSKGAAALPVVQKVVFLITHRVSTIRAADQIAFLENGVIAELGAHDELMAIESGRYRAFVSAEQNSAGQGDPRAAGEV